MGAGDDDDVAFVRADGHLLGKGDELSFAVGPQHLSQVDEHAVAVQTDTGRQSAREGIDRRVQGTT